MKQLYKNILLSIEQEEKNVSRSKKSIIDEGYFMVSFLRKQLTDLKIEITSNGFATVQDEINFFKYVKPEILGKLIYYNKVVRIESYSPTTYELTEVYYAEQLKQLRKEHMKHIAGSEFYKYYRSGRADKDDFFFRLGNINFFDGMNSFFFEVDWEFSTFYDYKIARVIAFDLLYSYLTSIGTRSGKDKIVYGDANETGEFSWTDSKNALIELVYALHISGSVSNGRAGLRRISNLFEELFEINLGDIHHAFHRMKYRTGEKASYLHFLKNSLEQYMDKDL
ncbi:RteC domain-containing protein [Chryseobacterium joostei]|uniref:RteC domain-containing protein n=1 Tax=Chryseobacterium joostei TaxID=112234 RepID=UPI003D0F593C